MKRMFAVFSLVGALSGFAAISMIAVGVTTSSCAMHGADTSQLSPQGLHEYKADEAVLIVNDVTTGVRAAVRAKVIPVNIGAQILTINKQVLDVIAADPVGWPSRITVLLKNGLDGIPPEWQARAKTYLDQVRVIIQGGVA